MAGVLEGLRAFDAALPERLAAGHRGTVLTGERAAIVDDAIRRLFAGAGEERVAVAAIGGYGAQDLTPGSDVDLLVLHEPGAAGDAAAGRAVGAILYPLWDAGVRASHAVRTPDGCRDQGATHLESLTSMLAMRPLAGPAALLEEAAGAVRSLTRGGADALVSALREERRARRARFGAVYERLEPDLKEAVGGLRDWQTVRWLAAASSAGGVRWTTHRAYEEAFTSTGHDGASAAADACARLLAVRLALHLANGGTSNVLAAEQHDAVAAILRFEPQAGWEPRDAVLRRVAADGRLVDGFVDALLGSTDDPDGGGSPSRWTATVRGCPEWDDVRGRPQRDPYHRFPVDVHLEHAAQEVERILRDPVDPFTAEAVRAVRDPGALVLGALLHDIGKVGLRGHVPIGGRIASRLLDRVDVTGEARDLILFLVREHFLLADTATRRNIDDEDLVLHVAARIRDAERLAMLYLLTMADAVATGPSAATPWRVGLIRDLVARVSRVFDRGLMDAGRAERFERAEERLRRALLRAGRAEPEVRAFLRVVPAAYVQWVRASDGPEHVPLMLPPPGATEARTHVAPGGSPGTYRLMVGARDRVGLLALVAGSLSVSGLSILSARAFTTSDGVALDGFDVRGAFEPEVGPERWERFDGLLAGALDGTVELRERVKTWRSHYRPPKASVPVRVAIDQDASDFSTVVEVTATDRLGLLFDLAEAFADGGLDVHVAKVATYGPRVVDVFYVVDRAGQKVTDASALTDLEQALAAAASPER